MAECPQKYAFSPMYAHIIPYQGRHSTGANGGSATPTLEERGQGSKSALLLLSTDLIFHIFFLHLFFS